jgi:hypothetical protein
MANDPPSHLRMGFGYSQARAAGLRGLRTDRSPRQVNRLINDRKTVREATLHLREEVEKEPEWAPFVQHWISEGLSAPEISQSLRNAQFDVVLRRKGYHGMRARYAKF